jgi:hypothetical protein
MPAEMPSALCVALPVAGADAAAPDELAESPSSQALVLDVDLPRLVHECRKRDAFDPDWLPRLAALHDLLLPLVTSVRNDPASR